MTAQCRRDAVAPGSLGAAIHICAGQLLARLESELLLAALARRVRAIKPTGEPVRRYNNTLRGLAALPVRLHAA